MNDRERSELRDMIIEHGRFPLKRDGSGLLDLKAIDDILQNTQYQRDRMTILGKLAHHGN